MPISWAGAVVSNEGEIHSFAGNERQNALTPFRSTPAPARPRPIDLCRRSRERSPDTAGFLPFRRPDARYDVTYDWAPRTSAIARQTRTRTHHLRPAGGPAGVRILTLRNRPTREALPRRALFRDRRSTSPSGEPWPDPGRARRRDRRVLFSNPTNDFRRGWAFACDEPDRRDNGVMRPRFSAAGTRSYQSRHGRDGQARSFLPGRRNPRRRLCRDRRDSGAKRDRCRCRAGSGGDARRGLPYGGAAKMPRRRNLLCRRRAIPGRNASTGSTSRPTIRTSTGSSITGCPISCSPRGFGAAPGRTSVAAPLAFAINCRMCCRSFLRSGRRAAPDRAACGTAVS